MAQMIMARKSLSYIGQACQSGLVALDVCDNVSFVQPETRPAMHTTLARIIRSVANPAGLAAIREPDCNLAIWQRTPFADFAPLLEGDPADLRFECTPAECTAMLAEGLLANGYAGTALHPALVADVEQLAKAFCAVMELARLELRLEVVRTDPCRKWHADYVTARLITTYVGEGTDWLDEDDADRVAAGQEPLAPQRLRSFDVGVFKGKLATDRPAIHRSPPIAGTGAARLLLVLNPASRLFVEGG